MSSRPSTVPGRGSQGFGAARRRLFPRLRDIRIRSKLALILAVPLVAIIGLAVVGVIDSGRRARDAGVVRSLTSLAVDVSALNHEMHRERMAAAEFLSDAKAAPEKYNGQVSSTDERIKAYQRARRELGDLPDSVAERLKRIDDHLATLNGTRQAVLARQQIPVAEAVLRYGVIVDDLVAYGDVLGQQAGNTELADALRAAAAFSKAKAATADEQAVAYSALSAGPLDTEQFSAFVATLTGQQEALLAFSLVASADQRSLVESTVTGDAVILADQVATAVSRSVNRTPLISAADAASSLGAVNDLMRWAELRLQDELVNDATTARDQVLRNALISSVVLLAVLTVAITLAVVLARSMVRSLSRLREGALTVAHHDLPDAVARLRDARVVGENGVEDFASELPDPIRLSNRDEVGQVAEAFNVVHREAVRIAAEQAALRASVSAMFLNLARRSQTLVDRMIGELDNIERTEEDPKRLAQLFALDHLATRMRRNDENLLVLAGADSSPPRREDALLVDALRAAQSEVELYNRVEFGTVDTDISIAARAVNDVVRLVAELLDNATRFSPPNSIVVAEARRIRDYVLIQVEDRGLGMSQEQMDALNLRLAQPPDVDVAAFRLMGLAVVGRLAARYGIRVELRPNAEGGTVANVSLPSSILILPQQRGREGMLGRSRAPLAVEPAAAGATWTQPASPVATTRAGTATLTEQWNANGQGTWDTTANPASQRPQVNAQPTYPAVMAAPAQPAPHPASAAARPDDVAELPIFREMEAVWFRVHGQQVQGPSQPPESAWTMPTAGYPPPHAAAPAGPPPGAAPVSGAAPASGVTPSMGPPVTPGRAPVGPSAPPRAGFGPPPSMPPTPTPMPPTPPAMSPTSPAMPPTSPATPAGPMPAGLAPDGRVGAAPEASPAPPRAYDPPPVPPETGAEVPRQRGGDPWRTRADDGWRLASAAANPTTGGTTRSGLPKRVPQAQLVPGGVEPLADRERARRTPEEVRGLLSAYHRGVQRGRSVSGEPGGAAAGPGPSKENNR